MRCLFDSPSAACKQLKLFRHDGTQTMVCRAHNHRRSEEGRWYVIPSAEWPPYAHAMFFADWDPQSEGAIRVGSVFYRGIHSSLQPQLTKPAGKATLLQRHWRWRDFLADEELFIEPVVTAAANLEGSPLRLAASAATVEANVGGDPYDREREWGRVLFQVDRAGTLERLEADAEPGPLKEFAGVRDVDEFLHALRGYEPEDWTWTEFSCSMSLGTAKKSKKKKKAAAEADRLVTTHELYETLMAPFEAWLFGE